MRIAAIQYKIWKNEVLYISRAGNILKQLGNMKECFCLNKFCKSPDEDNLPSNYRLPYCTSFLRPTDLLQNPQKLITTGYHVPICCLEHDRKITGNWL